MFLWRDSFQAEIGTHCNEDQVPDLLTGVDGLSVLEPFGAQLQGQLQLLE
jgi:hypothetical protein